MFFKIKTNPQSSFIRNLFLLLSTFLVLSLCIYGLYLNYIDYSAKSSLVSSLKSIVGLKKELISEHNDVLQTLSQEMSKLLHLRDSILEVEQKGFLQCCYLNITATVACVVLLVSIRSYVDSFFTDTSSPPSDTK